jgi:hypothetical protein
VEGARERVVRSPPDNQRPVVPAHAQAAGRAHARLETQDPAGPCPRNERPVVSPTSMRRSGRILRSIACRAAVEPLRPDSRRLRESSPPQRGRRWGASEGTAPREAVKNPPNRAHGASRSLPAAHFPTLAAIARRGPTIAGAISPISARSGAKDRRYFRLGALGAGRVAPHCLLDLGPPAAPTPLTCRRAVRLSNILYAALCLELPQEPASR